MKCVIQKVISASVSVEDKIVGAIGNGYVILVGFENGDDETIIDKMVNKIIKLRIFLDENEKMNLSIEDVNGEILSVSQFTLAANCKKGNRPSFTNSLEIDKAKEYYELFNEKLRYHKIKVANGIFQADMKVALINDGPITIILDSKEIF